jgi:hypothetical protein
LTECDLIKPIGFAFVKRDLIVSRCAAARFTDKEIALQDAREAFESESTIPHPV